MKIPAHIKAAIRELGLRTDDETAQVLFSDDLELASKHAAETAAYHVNRRQWWRLWLDIQDALGTSIEDTLSSVDTRSLYWLGQWAAQEKREDLAISALVHYHEQAGPDIPYASDVSTLAGLLLNRREYQQLASLCQRISEAGESGPKTDAFWLIARIHVEGEVSANANLAECLRRYPHASCLWLVKAILERGDSGNSDKCLEIFVKTGAVAEEFLLHYAEAWLPGMKTRLDVLSQRFGQPWKQFDDEEFDANWLTARGARPYLVKHNSPHWFGGDHFTMPDCVGCGQKVRQFFVVDPAAEPVLAQDFSCWPQLPFISCLECGIQLGRNDFSVHWDDSRIEWIAYELSSKRFGKCYAPNAASPIPPKAHIALRWLPAVACHDDIPHDENRGDPPQIGGKPDWVQYPERPHCPKCWEGMLFYGALGSTDDSMPVPIMVNNGSGYLYHFACNRCHVISIISQCT